MDNCSKLLKYAPTPEEVSLVRDYEGDPEDLAPCERFFYNFRNMDNIQERLKMWMYKMTVKNIT